MKKRFKFTVQINKKVIVEAENIQEAKQLVIEQNIAEGVPADAYITEGKELE